MNVELAKKHYNYLMYKGNIYRIAKLSTQIEVIVHVKNRVMTALKWKRGGRYGACDTSDLEMWNLNLGFRFASNEEISRTEEKLSKKVQFENGELKCFEFECKLILTEKPNDLPPMSPPNMKCIDMGQDVIFVSLFLADRNLKGAEQLMSFVTLGLVGEYTIYDTSDIQGEDFKKFFEKNWAKLGEFENYVHAGRINKLFITRKGEKPTVKKLKDVRYNDK